MVISGRGYTINPFWPQGASHSEDNDDYLVAEKVLDKPNDGQDEEKKENS